MTKRDCKCGCGRSIKHKHVNAKFFNQKHKDKYWNEENPRSGYYKSEQREHNEVMDMVESGWDAHKDIW